MHHEAGGGRRPRPRLRRQPGQHAEERRQPGTGDGRQPRALPCLHCHVRLRADDDPGPHQQLGPVPAELLEEDPLLVSRRPPVGGGKVHQHGQHPCPLDVPEELVAEPAALAGSLDEPGDVCDDQLRVVHAHDAEMRLQGREGVVGDLGLGRRDAADQRALAGVREADQRHVRHQLELEVVPALLPHLSLLGEAGRPAAVVQEAGVPPTAPPAGRRQPAVSARHQVGEHLAVELLDHRALGDGDGRGLAVPPVAAFARPVTAVAGPAVRVVAEGEERGDVAVGDKPDVAALAAVTAVGATLRDVRLPPERHRAGAPVARLHVELGLVDEPRHRSSFVRELRPPGRARHAMDATSLGGGRRPACGPCGSRTSRCPARGRTGCRRRPCPR